MIERAAGCLEIGGRCLLRIPKKPFRSQRFLHSTFWSHGAGDIDLPSWWIALLQVPQLKNPTSSTKTMTDRLQEGGLMDFLYPTQTVAFFQQLVSKDMTALLNYRRRRYAYMRARAYASSASDSLGIVGGEEPVLATESGEDDVRSRMSGLLQNEVSSTDNEDIWRAYQSLRDMLLSPSPVEFIKLLRRLSSSNRKIDLERFLRLFNAIPITERRAIHYSLAVNAALGQNELGTALDLHREALSRIQGSVGTSAILRYTVQREQWQPAIETWYGCWYRKQMYYERPDMWTGLDDIPLPDLMDKAASAADFAVNVAESASHHAGGAARDFALQLILRSFTIRGTMFDSHKANELFEKAKVLKQPDLKIYRTTILQFLSIDSHDHGRAAISRYRQMRADSATVPDRRLMRALLGRLCAIRSSTGIFMMLEDYRRYYDGPPPGALKQIILALAEQGNSEAVFSLFEEYKTRFGTPTDSSLINPLIYVYFRRGQIEKAIQIFNSLQKNYGFKPDIGSWNLVISTFARVGDRDGAMTWSTKLAKAGSRPNGQTYVTLMRMYAKRGDLEAVIDLFQQLKSDNIKVTMAMVDTIVLAQVNNDLLDEAQNTAEEALQMDLNGSRTRMWNSILNAHAMRRDLDKVNELHKRMQEVGVPPDSMTYAALLQSLVIAKQPDAAKKLLQVVMPRSKIRASPLHYAIVMGGYIEVKDFPSVFSLYNRMLKRNLRPTPSSQNAVLRAAAGADMQHTSTEEGEQMELGRAQEILEQTLARMDPMELASNEPVKFFGVSRLDEAFASSYFSFLIFVYGRRKAFDKVSELYSQYITTAQKFRPDVEVSPPIQMLSALMAANLTANDHGEVERCWYLALDKAEKLARRSKSADLSESGWVLPSRRFIMNIPLLHYIRSLEAQHRIDDIIATIDELHISGFALSSKSWNAYVQILARNDREILAYELCEKQLIEGWPGWEVMGGTWGVYRRFRAMTPTRLQPNQRMPTYPTLVFLAGVYMDAQSATNNRLEELTKVAPKTVDAVRNMPKLDDGLQSRVLRRY